MKSKPPSKRTSHESTGQDDDTIRLNRVLANSGICSRREADRHIEMGLVQVNGKIITKMGTKVTFSDEIKFDGQTINKAQKTYLLLNKPKGFVATSRKGKKINKTTQDLIQNTISHETPPVDEMGRTASGLLLLTNDSALQKKLEDNPKIKMVYHIKLAKPLSAMAKDNLIKGIKIQKKIYAIKKRDLSKPLITLVADAKMLSDYVTELPENIHTLLKSDVPTTLVYPKGKGLAKGVIAHNGSVAIRIPKAGFALDLVKSFGKPIVSTSANISDALVPESVDEIDPHILAQVDEIVPLNKEKGARIPSQVLQLMPDGSVKQLR